MECGDDFPYLELFLAGKDPLDAAQWQRWVGSIRPSAMRKEVLPKGGGT